MLNPDSLDMLSAFGAEGTMGMGTRELLIYLVPTTVVYDTQTAALRGADQKPTKGPRKQA